MNLSTFFEQQLAATAEGFVWAANQVPPDRRLQAPPATAWLGEWHLPRHVFHMLVYEREIALPSMKQWLGATQPDLSRFPSEDALWTQEGEGQPLERLIEQFQAVRAAQIELLPRFTGADWEAERETIWGLMPLRWVVGKTFQHTAEHIHDVMRLSLFWDTALAREARERERAEAPVRE